MGAKKPKKLKCGCALSPNPCEHLEAKLPSMHQGNAQNKHSYTDQLDGFSIGVPAPLGAVPESKIKEFTAKLKKWGVNPELIDILVARHVYDKTLAQIAKDEGSTVGMVYYMYKLAKEQARKGILAERKRKGLT